MTDSATTFFAQISYFFEAFWAFVFRVLSLKPRPTTHTHDLEAGLPSDPVKEEVPGHFNAAIPVKGEVPGHANAAIPSKGEVPGHSNAVMPVVSRSCPANVFLDITLNPDGKNREAKANGINTDHGRQIFPTVKNDKILPISSPAIPTNTKIYAVDNRSKHRAMQFGPSAHKLTEDHPKSKSRKHADSISDLLDQFPAPPTHNPLFHPVLNKVDVLQSVKKTLPAPGESCPSPTISEDSTVSSSSGSHSLLSTDPSTSTSNETANTSVQEIIKSIPYRYHDVVDGPREANLQKGDISKERSTRPVVAPLCIVKKNKNKVQPVVVPLELPIPRIVGSGNWELAMDQVLQAFRDAELEDQDFRDLFYGDSSFVSQSSVVDSSGDDRSDLDGFVEALSMSTAAPDLVVLKAEDLANVSLSSEVAVAHRIIEVKDEVNIVDLPMPGRCDCEWYEDSYSWTAVTDHDDDSQEDDQWGDRFELDGYVS